MYALRRHGVRVHVRVISHYSHFEPGKLTPHITRNVSESDESQGSALYRVQRRSQSVIPLACPDGTIESRDATHNSKEQTDKMIGSAVAGRRRGVGDDDAASSRLLDRDVVSAAASADDAPTPRYQGQAAGG